MPRVNLVAHGVQVELEAAEISAHELGIRALELLKMALDMSKPEVVGFRPPPDKSWVETE